MQSLTVSEEIVMKSVWELGGNCTLSQITMQEEEHEKEWVLQTVATFLKHLEDKHYLRPYKDGRFLHYEILIEEEKYKQHSFRKFLHFWWNGDIRNFICDIFQKDFLSPKEVEIFKKCCRSYIN